MRRIALVYFDAGGGHRNAAMALEQAIKHSPGQSNLPWEVELVNLQEILDSIDIIRKLTGLRVQDAYNRMLQNGWTLGSTQLIDRKSTRLNSSHMSISYAVFCLKKKKTITK